MTANLRKESGATISPSEFETEAKKYFPKPGDNKQTLENKKNARIDAQLGMKVAAGPGIDRLEREKKKYSDEKKRFKYNPETGALE